ncbi:MAG: bile acid:sodium symporter family protein, partial [Gemmataceae bacterium]
MDGRANPLARFSRFLHRNFIWFLLSSYVVAAVAPRAGLAIKDVELARLTLFGESIRVSLPMLLLGLLLLNAGLGVQTAQLRHLLRRPWSLVTGLAANLLIPIAYIFIVSRTMRLWHNPDEVQNILVGLALVAAMPIAGSSTAWTQNANGDLSLSLALVLFSTLLSPLTAPLTFELGEQMAEGEYAQILDDLETQGGGLFLMICVILPSLLGTVLRPAFGEPRITAAKPMLKLLNALNLLVLNYSNASVSLPKALVEPDWDFLGVILIVVVGMCLLAFTAGWLLSRLFRVELPQRISLMFGLGMNNNGTGLVLATVALPHYPRVMLPIILYNLVQHAVAGSIDFLMFRREPNGAATVR